MVLRALLLLALLPAVACSSEPTDGPIDVLVRVGVVALDARNTPVVVLEEQDGPRLLPIWIGMEIFNGIWQLGDSPGKGGVAHWAHIAGFFFGVGVPPLLKVLELEKFFPVFTKSETGKEVKVSSAQSQQFKYMLDPEYRRGKKLVDDEDLGNAVWAFESLLEKFPGELGVGRVGDRVGRNAGRDRARPAW